jgi:hypothetical protein
MLDNLKEYFKKNPTLFCTKLVETKLPENLKIPATNSEMLELWQLAKEDNPDFDYDAGEGQDGIVPDFVEAYKNQILIQELFGLFKVNNWESLAQSINHIENSNDKYIQTEKLLQKLNLEAKPIQDNQEIKEIINNILAR